MGQHTKNILIIALGVIFFFGVGALVYSYHDSLQGDSALKAIVLHQTLNPAAPFYIENKGKKFNVEIKDTDKGRTEGLSGSTGLNDDQAVLFMFDKPDLYRMWMKDMLFPIDIIWLDEDFKAIDLKKDVLPSTYPESFGPNAPALYVIELNAGLSDEFGFAIGDLWNVSEK